MSLWLLTHVLAAVAVVFIGHRLAAIRPDCGWRGHLWGIGHLLVACGLIAHLLGVAGYVMPLIAAGLALSHAVNPKCRRTDR